MLALFFGFKFFPGKFFFLKVFWFPLFPSREPFVLYRGPEFFPGALFGPARAGARLPHRNRFCGPRAPVGSAVLPWARLALAYVPRPPGPGRFGPWFLSGAVLFPFLFAGSGCVFLPKNWFFLPFSLRRYCLGRWPLALPCPVPPAKQGGRAPFPPLGPQKFLGGFGRFFVFFFPRPGK